MVSGRFKSRTFARVKVRTPGGKTVMHYIKRKPKLGVCPETGEKLKGVPRERPYKMMKLAKTKKRPSRPYAGNLSSNAMRAKMKAKARLIK
jgi:large subunit ribosomal protein L34e